MFPLLGNSLSSLLRKKNSHGFWSKFFLQNSTRFI